MFRFKDLKMGIFKPGGIVQKEIGQNFSVSFRISALFLDKMPVLVNLCSVSKCSINGKPIVASVVKCHILISLEDGRHKSLHSIIWFFTV